MRNTLIPLMLILFFAGVATAEDPPARPDQWSVAFADYVLRRWPDPNTITPKKWEYENSIVLHGMEKVYLKTGDSRYLDYIRTFVDIYVDENGVVDMDRENPNLDLVQPGVLTLFLYDQTRDEKYHQAGRYLCEVVYDYPRNALGGFYHKRKYPNEMWADGIYMAQPFCVKFSRMFGENTGNYGMAVDQVVMVHEKALDAATGLLIHAWDADRNAAWADPETGRSSYIWSRGMGWYFMALVDILEFLPPEHPGYDDLAAILNDLVSGLAKTQSDSGVWYQVVDQADREGNWPELSGTLMYVYSIKKGIRLGLLDQRYDAIAARGWAGAQAFLRVTADGDPEISDVVQGMGVQPTFESYVNKRRLVNSPHGLCAIMFAASEIEF